MTMSGTRFEALDLRDPQQPLGVEREGELRPARLTTFQPRIIRQGGAPDGTPAPVDPVAEARRIIEAARQQAAHMLEQSRAVIAADREAAREAGQREGYAAGMAEADAETAGLVATCERIGINVMEERQRLLDESERDVIDLAMAIAERVVNAAIDIDPDLVVDVCRGAMRRAFQRESMVVLAHPADLARLREAGPKLAAELGGVSHLDFVEERRLARGSVIVRTPAGEIDATFAGKSQRIEAALQEQVRERRAQHDA